MNIIHRLPHVVYDKCNSVSLITSSFGMEGYMKFKYYIFSYYIQYYVLVQIILNTE